jgi:transcriptional regulator with XRE-family HTH domain
MAKLGERLKMLRKEKRMTQPELAELLNQSLRAYQYYESCEHIPEFPNLVLLADFYDVSMDYLIGRSETRERQP